VHSRFSLLLIMVVIFVGVSALTRVVLLLSCLNSVHLSLWQLTAIFGIGAFYDLVAAAYYFIPLVIYLMIVPSKLFYSRWHQHFLYGLLFVTGFCILFNAVSEWFFWEEFGKRFNFIAVDYLVYTHEVIHNILESYPIALLLGIIALLNTLVFYFVVSPSSWFRNAFDRHASLKSTLTTGVLLLLVPLLFFMLLDKQHLSNISHNTFNNELAKNGLYSLFSAFRHNTLEYTEFYKTKDLNTVMAQLDKLEGFNNTHRKQIQSSGSEQHYNIMLIMVESLSAKYMGIYGNPKGLTPHLDALAKKALFFDNLYATGTRTVRGMEAVTLSIPPTPGRSIVKRPDNHNMFSSGFIFQDKGYHNTFIYAGHGYFDNMNAFFSHNGFHIVDRTRFSDDEIHFANVWGVSDEDLFDKALKESDKSYAKQQPFFNFIMTTSNHRPYTYPDGKIDIPSHTGRDGGVKYTDYAINEFLQKARSKPWFDQTLFVIVADHNGGSAGKNTLPLWRYKIPLIVYAPKLIKPQVVHKLASQIDVMPTLMALLHFRYESMFYGHDILDKTFHERAFIGNYQQLGYLEQNRLTLLFPNRHSKTYAVTEQRLDGVTYQETPLNSDDELHAITYYQSAGYFYDNHLYSRHPL